MTMGTQPTGRGALRQKSVVTRLLGACIALLLMLPLNSSADTATAPSLLWIGQARGLLAVDVDEGQVLVEIPTQQSVHAVAADTVNQRVWAQLGLNTIKAYDFEGIELYSTTLPGSILDILNPRVLTVDNLTGNVWTAIGNRLYRLDAEGTLQGEYSPGSQHFRALTTDTSRGRLWAADRTTLYALNTDGEEAFRVSVSDLGLGGIQDIAFDHHLDRLWVAGNAILQRYTGDGTRDFSANIPGNTSVIAPDQRGGLWTATPTNLHHINESGALEFSLQPFPGGGLLGLLLEPTVDLVAEPDSGTAWITSKKRIRHYDLSSTLLHTVLPGSGGGLTRNISSLSRFRSAIAEILVASPENGALINDSMPTILLTTEGFAPTAQALSIEAGGVLVAAICTDNGDDFECALTETLPEGESTLVVTASIEAGQRVESAPTTFTVDTVSPGIQVHHPSPDFITNEAELVLSGELSEPATFRVNNETVELSPDRTFSHGISLTDGINPLALEAEDPAGNPTIVIHTVTLDTVPPEEVLADHVAISGPDQGSVTVTGSAGSAEPDAHVRIKNLRTGQVTTAVITIEGGFVVHLAAQADDELEIVAIDAAGNTSSAITLSVSSGELPPDPTTVATPLSTTAITPFGDSVAFLHTGPNAIQTNVAPGTIDPLRAAVVRGRVLRRDSSPLGGVTVSVQGHPEYGQTRTRTDGGYDLVVNGGGQVTLNFSLTGHLPAQRPVRLPWREYAIVDDLVLITVDSQVTTVDLASMPDLAVASGRPVTDGDGTRQATVMFEQGTTAEMVMPDGSRQALTQLDVRATEYTVGPTGPAAMPGNLPTTSGYTYAVELSVDQALQAGATSVEFNQPVWLHVDNFLNFPVGSPVPTGYYDRSKAAWVAADDGLVISVLSVSNGIAELDVDGSGMPADSQTLTQLRLSDIERQKLADRFSPGQSFWRVGLMHFTPWDCNWPFGPPPGAEPPRMEIPQTDSQLPYPDIQCASIIECQSQVLRERIPITGTRFSLNYRSDRTLGRRVAHTLEIPLTGSSTPDDLKRIDLEVSVAGRTFTYSFPAAANQQYIFEWDGVDVYGRTPQGAVAANIRIGYVYNGYYFQPGDSTTQSFGQISSTTEVIGNAAREEVTLWRHATRRISTLPAVAAGLGSWTLSAHHQYDPQSRVLYLGDGRRLEGTHQYPVLDWIVSADSATQTTSVDAPRDIAIDQDGSLLVADTANYRIIRIASDGSVHPIAGIGEPGSSGDGGPALQARLKPAAIALGSDGSIYVADEENHRVRKIDANGTITTIAGAGSSGFSGDGGPASEALLSAPIDIATGPSGELYIADRNNRRVRHISVNGIITTVAGKGDSGSTRDDGIPATEARLSTLSSVDVDSDGSLYIAVSSRVRKITADGIITTLTDDLESAPRRVAVGLDGSVFVSHGSGSPLAWGANQHISRIDSQGGVTIIAGSGSPSLDAPTGSPATQVNLDLPTGLATSPDGRLYFTNLGSDSIGVIGSPFPGVSPGDIAIPSREGHALYIFSPEGRHLSTKQALTGTALYTFSYDVEGRLSAISDSHNNVTTIERLPDGTPASIIGADGHRSRLMLSASGYLSVVISPDSERWEMNYSEDGLLTHFSNRGGAISTYIYDHNGRLTRDANQIGGFFDFQRTEDEVGYQVTMDSAVGRQTTYKVDDEPDSATRRMTTFPDQTQAVALMLSNGTTTLMEKDGTTIDRVEGADPRFGMQAPFIQSATTSTPDGLLASYVATQSADTSVSNELLRLTKYFELNGRGYQSVYTVDERQYLHTTPEDRQIATLINQHAQLRMQQVDGLAPSIFTYDARGRLSTVERGSGPDQRTATIAYGSAGFPASVTDTMNRTITYDHDAVGRVTKQTFPGGRAISFSYDPNGNLTSITPPGRDAHIFTYDSVDQLDDYTPPELPEGSTVTQYQYNLDKDLTLVTRPDGNTIAFDYNAPGMKLSAVTIDAGSYGYSYQPASGQLNTLSAPGGLSLSYAYDGFLLTSEALSGQVAGTVTWTYDNNFWTTGLSVNGDSVNFSYDDDGLLTGAGSMTLTPDVQHGLLRSTSLANVTTSQDYNAFGEVERILARYETDDLYGAQYQRDKLGRITQKAETVQGQTQLHGYSYDSAGRLQAVTLNGTTISTYVYDANGNRTFLNATEGQYDEQDRLLSYGNASYSYTKNGERKTRTQSGATTTYDYDVLGNLRTVSLPGDIEIEYLIDGRNRRVGKKVNGMLTQGFLYQDQLNPVAELDGSGNIKSRFVYADKGNVPSYMIRGDTTYRIVSDQLGSPRLVVNADTGEVVQRMDYDEFGNVTNDTNPGFQPFGFAGGIYDQHTQLTRFGARDYDAEAGRWTAKDPIMFAGGDTNLYGYTLNDPVNLIDPAGMQGVFIPTDTQYRHLMGYSGASRETVERAMNMPPIAFEIARSNARRCIGCLIRELAGDAAQSAAIDAGVGLAARHTPPQFGLPLSLLYGRYRSSGLARGMETYDFYQSVRSCTVDR
jgi:RHS repeat-associated protein